MFRKRRLAAQRDFASHSLRANQKFVEKKQAIYSCLCYNRARVGLWSIDMKSTNAISCISYTDTIARTSLKALARESAKE